MHLFTVILLRNRNHIVSKTKRAKADNTKRDLDYYYIDITKTESHNCFTIMTNPLSHLNNIVCFLCELDTKLSKYISSILKAYFRRERV